MRDSVVVESSMVRLRMNKFFACGKLNVIFIPNEVIKWTAI